MTAEELVDALRKKPFAPFRITLTEGSTYDIRHPELCMPGRRTVTIGLAKPDDPDLLYERTTLVDLIHIVKLDYLNEPVSPKSNGVA